jgi:hypothetical protein
MLNQAKTTVGSTTRKTLAFLLAYCMFATSAWSLALPMDGLAFPHAKSRFLVYPSWNSAGTSAVYPPAAVTEAINAASPSAPPVAYSNFAELNAPSSSMAYDEQIPQNCTAHTNVPSTDGDDGTDTYRSYSYDDEQTTPVIVATGFQIFGPQAYVRTNSDSPDNFTSAITVPAWTSQPFYLHLENGDSSGNHRTDKGATIVINGTTILNSSFDDKIGSIDCAISLTAASTMNVTLSGKSGSFISLAVLAQSNDHTAPSLSITAPLTGGSVNTVTPHLALAYNDQPGVGETTASGVNLETLQVLLDGTDRTSLFTKRINDATADLPANLGLAQGTHILTASIKDNAGNSSQATSQFQVDVTPLTLQIVQPTQNAFLNTTTPQIQLSYIDNLAVDTSTLSVKINGIENSLLFTKTGTSATATLTAATALPQGANQIVASIRDSAGNQASSSVNFNVDTTLPVVTILHPTPGSLHGLALVEYKIEFTDDQALDPATIAITVDGAPVAAPAPVQNIVAGTVTLVDGQHTIAATVRDTAKNLGGASSIFSVDTTAPDIHVTQPIAGALLDTASTPVKIHYGDSQSINVASLQVTLDGNDQTAQFAASATATDAAGTLVGLSEGPHTIAAQITDPTGNTGKTSSTLFVDTIKPQLAIVSPVGPVNTTTPSAQIQYSDSGSGVNTDTLQVLLDGVDVTSSFSKGVTSAAGTLATPTGLSEGPHTLQVTVADKAGNPSVAASASFQVDVTPATASFSSPVNNSFISNTQPALVLDYSDSGSGVNIASVHIFLQQGTATETEITSSFKVGPTQATASLSAASALTQGSYRLRAQLSDNAGNPTPAFSAFQVDIIPPTYTILSPPGGSSINTATPSFEVNYQDDSSGVDPSKFAVRVDGIDRTADFTSADLHAMGALQPTEALADGTHQVEVTVVDRAGNTATIIPQSFLVDTIAPVISITTAAVNGTTTNALLPISVSYSDAGSGVDVTSLHVLIDGVDQTTAFTPTATGASGVPAAPLGAGLHTITATIRDLAGNISAPATASFSVSAATPPQIAITQPVDGAFTNANSVVVTGSVTSALSVSVTVEGVPATLQGGNFTSAAVALGPEPAQIIHVVATDSSGTATAAQVTVNIDRTRPTITAVVNPQPNAAGWNNSEVTVTFTCADAGSGIATCATPVTLSSEGASQPVTGIATDRAGNTATSAPVLVSIDKGVPTIFATANPPSDPVSGWNKTDVVVSYICADSLSGIAICPAPVTVSSEGSALSVTGQAIDKAGNASAPVITSLKIDKTPPVVSVTTSPVAINGWNNSNVSVTFTCSDSMSGVASCPAPTTISSEGQNQPIPGQAIDIAGNIADVAVSGMTVSIDKTAPSIVQLSTPDHISGLHGGQISAIVNDNFTVSQVVFKLNGAPIGTQTSAPFAANLLVPAGSNPGDTLTVTVEATDQAGNLATSSRVVRVAADGVIVGQVLDDATSFPVLQATVQVISPTGTYDKTDDHGHYSLQANDPHLFLSIAGPSTAPKPTTSVEREVFVQDGVGTVPVDARLTTLADPVTIGAGGATVISGAISLPVLAGSVVAGTTVRLTPLSGQGLPGLLPLGWSPLAAFNLQISSPATGLVAGIGNLPSLPAILASYDRSLHAWTVLATSIQPLSGSASVPVPGAGDYALVVADVTNPPMEVPPVNDPLLGIDMALLDATATTSGSLAPAILPASGGTAVATLGVQSPGFVPSGTVIQANLSEKFSLKSGQAVSEENRSEDIVLYGAAAPASASLGAQFPVSPSQKFANGDLLSGKVHLDFLAGREGVRGEEGGSDPLTLSDGVATLSVPGGALAEDTAVSLQSIPLEDFIPTNTSMNAVQEMLVDFSGETLNTPAQLSISATGFNPADNFLLAQVVRVNGVPQMVVVAIAMVQGQNLVSVATPGLPGVLTGGEYVFYDLPSPIGYVAGIVSSSLGPVQAMVSTDTLAIGYFTGADGHYVIPTLIKTVNVSATVPNSSLSGSAPVQPIAAQTVQQNILLVGTVTGAVVSPADQSLGVPVSTQISITTTAPLDPAAVGQATFSLLQGVTPVPLQAPVFSVSGTVLTYAPQNNLQPSTQYKAQVTGLRDIFQNPVVVPTVTFTTKSVIAPNFDPSAIIFSFPDQNGNIHVSAPAGSLQSGTKVLIVDQSNAVVLSLTAVNDGSLSGDFPATINDLLQITVTDPLGGTSTFTLTQFNSADGSVAVGTHGGTVAGPGGVSMTIPEGALDQAAVFSLHPLGVDALPELPSVAGATFGSGIQVNSPSMPFFKKEVKFSFPKPSDAPDGAFYYVYRQLVDEHNNNYFETLDHAFVQGTGSAAQVVMASPPFCGYRNSYRNFNTVANTSFVPSVAASNNIFVMWDRVSQSSGQPGISSQGLIVGRALQTVPPKPGQTDSTFVPIPGATIWIGLANTPSKNVAITSDSCGQFTIFDPQLGGGARDITAKASINGSDVILHATAVEVNGVQTDDATYLVTAGLEGQYRNIGRVTFTFPASTPPPPPAQVDIRLYTEDSNNSRVIAGGILASGTPLVIAFKTPLQVTGVSLSGRQLAVKADFLDNPKDQQPLLDFRALDSASGDSLERVVLGDPGPYTLSVTAISPFGGTPITVSKSFLVVAAGGDNTGVTSGKAPQIIATIPVQNAVRVSIGAFPEIVFSEPITNVPDNVTLTDADGNSPPIALLGVRADGSVANPVGSGDFVTSITVQPLTGLRLSTVYKLSLNSIIADKNNPPLSLQPFTLQFTTVGPQEVDQITDDSPLTHPIVIGDRLYAGKVDTVQSRVEVFDISDAINPVDKGFSDSFAGRAVDVAGLASSPVVRCLSEVLPGEACPQQSGDGPLIAVAATIGNDNVLLPSNIWFFDVTNPDQPLRVGAMSATTSATQDGSLIRIFMKGPFVYTSTSNKGLQVIDVQQAVTEFQQTPAIQFGGAITTDGNGFALDAVVNTIPVSITETTGLVVPALMLDVKAADYSTAPSPDPAAPVPSQSLIVATGKLPFVVADPQLGGLGAILYPARDSVGTGLSQAPLIDGVAGQFQMQQGRAIALGNLPVTDLLGVTTTTPIAVVVGLGSKTSGSSGALTTPLLAIVDMTTPKTPSPRGFVVLTDNAGNAVQPVDVIIKDNLALVGTDAKKVLIVNLSDPSRPTISGEIDGAFGDRLALTNDGLLVTTSPNSALGGVHTASFGSQCSAFRESLRNSSLAANPPLFKDDSHLAWTVSGGFSQPMEGASASMLDQDGLVLTNVRLGRRQMAQTMSLPYIQLARTGSALKCHLLANSENACTGVAPGVNARSHLLAYTSNLSPDGKDYFYEAKFLLDYLDGNPDDDPTAPDSCILITQRYEFYKEGLKPLEPFGHFPSAQFKPLVQYRYFTDNGPPVQTMTTAQRMHFDPRTPNPIGLQPAITASLKAAATGAMMSCDFDPLLQGSNCLPVGLDAGAADFSLLGMFGGKSPLAAETYVPVIQNGKNAILFDPVRNRQTIIDNVHQYPTPEDIPDQPMDEPGLTTFGCPACVHIHLRWSSLFNIQKLQDTAAEIADIGSLVVTGGVDPFVVTPLVRSVVGQLASNVLDPTFDNHNGSLNIPPNSPQNVDIAILRSGGEEEQHLSGTVKDLFINRGATPPFGQNILPSILGTQATPVVWYVASSNLKSDTFFFHGGGFGTYYVNRIDFPSSGSGQLLLLNVEHSRPVQYTVSPERWDISLSPGGILPLPVPVSFALPVLQGTLAGVDDITGTGPDKDPQMVFGPNTLKFTVDVSLDDQNLALTPPLSPKHEWIRTFSFTQPGRQEP